jgi:membrane fusion protein (multidrug efflux system)
LPPIAKRIRLIVGILAALVLLVFAKLAMNHGRETGGPGAGGRSGGGPGGGGPVPVRIEVVHAERLADRITSVGTIHPNERVEIRTEVSGRVREIAFKEGARVARGDLLVKIDDSELRAQLARAESRLAIAEKEEQRQRDLYEQRVASQRDFDNSINNLAVARAEADLIRAQLAKTDIRAPFAGVVGLRSVSEGSYATPATPITTLVDERQVKIDFTVPEQYAGRINAGDKIHFTVEGSSRVFEGTVYALESAIDAGTRTLGVRAASPNADGALVPGAFAEVDVVFPEREVSLVPSFAVVPALRDHSVFVLRSGKAEVRPVRIGERTEEHVEVTEGLAAGDTLIVSGILQLRPGAPVSVVPSS